MKQGSVESVIQLFASGGECIVKWDKRVVALILAVIIVCPLFAVPVQAQEQTILDKLVVLPSGDYNRSEADAMKQRLEKIPTSVLNALYSKGVKIKLTQGAITNEPELAYLKGVVPRGWEGTGLTWDDVPGVSERVVAVRIGYSEKGKGHNSLNLEIHETLHAVDRLVFNEISGTEEFNTIFNKEASVKYKGDGYVSTYPTEYFAEAASLYLFSDTTRGDLKSSMPLTYEFMAKLFAS